MSVSAQQEPFTASNGWHISKYGALRTSDRLPQISGTCLAGARQYFLEERDAELGRWRDPGNTDMVCYSVGGDRVRVLSENSGSASEYVRDFLAFDYDRFSLAASRYFAAHPVKRTPTEPGVYKRRPDPIGISFYMRGEDGDWSCNLGYSWCDIEASDLPDDLVRLTVEEGK